MQPRVAIPTLSVADGMYAWERAGLEVRRGPLAPGEGDLGA